MKSENILINDFENLDKGFLMTAKTVGLTMGLNGKLSLLDRNDKPPYLTRDGVSVARNIRFSQKTMNFGALLCIQGCTTTLEKVGDGTSGTAVMMASYLTNIKREQFNKTVERGMHKGVAEVYDYLNKLSKKAVKKDLKHIARVATNNDSSLADIISEAFEYSGKTGIIEVILNDDKANTEFIKREGLRLEGYGYGSPFFINRQDKKLMYEGENVGILVALGWEYNPTVINLIKQFYDTNGGDRNLPLTVFLERPVPEMTDKLIGIKQVGYNLNLVYATSYDEYESETLINDICNFTGAVALNPRTPEVETKFGIADKLTSTIDETTIIVFEVPTVFRTTLDALQKADVKDTRRIKRLTTNASVIEVGGFNPIQSKETFDRVEDAVFSYKTATKEGIICGGGATLVYINGLMNTRFESKDEQRGYDLVKTVMLSPFLQILENSNRKQSYKKTNWFTSLWDTEVHTDYITPAKSEYGIGYNGITDKITNLIDDGIVDSKLSIRVAIESSLTVAIQMLSISSVCHFPENQYL
jgi:chaperonin GroEL